MNKCEVNKTIYQIEEKKESNVEYEAFQRIDFMV